MRQHQLIRRLILLLTFGYILVGSAAGQSELSPEQKQKLKLFEAKLRAVQGGRHRLTSTYRLSRKTSETYSR